MIQRARRGSDQFWKYIHTALKSISAQADRSEPDRNGTAPPTFQIKVFPQPLTDDQLIPTREKSQTPRRQVKV
ncbi:hypothetical protein EI94DRAFT_1749454 [Lactarius quietus]|nr:hypothetical protein EI94DRAFT_1761561 [Lactarius quietus]KAF8258102.1 hypothetical protein EI94DRAFT_1755671 [Lactarius quietus]KAF8260130.1 hypothetical protein EI94DRAFT_1749454 [Lactarius quietus]